MPVGGIDCTASWDGHWTLLKKAWRVLKVLTHVHWGAIHQLVGRTSWDNYTSSLVSAINFVYSHGAQRSSIPPRGMAKTILQFNIIKAINILPHQNVFITCIIVKATTNRHIPTVVVELQYSLFILKATVNFPIRHRASMIASQLGYLVSWSQISNISVLQRVMSLW